MEFDHALHHFALRMIQQQHPRVNPTGYTVTAVGFTGTEHLTTMTVAIRTKSRHVRQYQLVFVTKHLLQQFYADLKQHRPIDVTTWS